MDKRFPNKPLELHARPTDVDLENFIEAAEEQRNTKFSYVWKSTQQEEFMISLHFVSESQIEWRMFSGSEENAKELWVNITDDATDIYTMIIKSSGEDLEKAIKNDLKRTRELLRGPAAKEERDGPFDGTKKMMAGELERLRKSNQSALAGELSLVHITNVMQSVSMSKMSGRLSIDAKESQVDIFFLNGAPVHATGTMGDGKECILRAVGLEEGRFHFDAETRTDQRTINEPIESVILQGAKLVDDTQYLTEMGLVNESVLVRTNAMISEQQFEELLASGEPGDLNLLKSVYIAIDDQSSVNEIVRRIGLSRMYWLDALAKLIRCKAIFIKADSPDGEILKPKELPSEVKSTVTATMVNDDTGLFHYPAFLYLLGHEANRADGEHPLSIIVFELLGDNKASLPKAVLEGIIWLINAIKRPVDIVGHYEELGYALIMPDTKAHTAAAFAERIAESINSDPLIRSVEIRNVKMAFGIATLPGDVDDMYSLLAAAEMARDYSYNNGSPVVMAQALAPQN